MRHTRHRRDANHVEIERALRAVTWVLDVHNTSIGCDLIARHTKTYEPVFIEVKDGDKPPSGRRLTESELRLQAAFSGHFRVVLNVDDALRAVGLKQVFYGQAAASFLPKPTADTCGQLGWCSSPCAQARNHVIPLAK